ncbi:hypothetical protein KUTeg_024009 [Tegillarca granosa]|uniref:Anhydro-N-acetylmuramic acid kinase n=1 Tax=Tegillarca granosa TaxID=220873 RepID=A0ABQ9E2H4_TEGGR|nr:hypothetical protein KUTeg_024009 [Tegillarca granosa]
MASFRGIGCMSGSSLDGLDICLVEFTGDKDTDIWSYHVLESETIKYDKSLEDRLRHAATMTAEDFIKLHIDYGHFIGQQVIDFLNAREILSVDFAASHGHTILHQPNDGYTFQLGDGETTASYFNFPFVSNFRTKDVALGGQGAPLVPGGEKHLFSPNDICINLGGIANIGLKGEIGYDVCPCNYVMNRLAKLYDNNIEFDKDGEIAKQGQIIQEIFEQLEALPFYTQEPPKSIGAEWIESYVLPKLDTTKYSTPDLMRTFVEHVAARLETALKDSKRWLMENGSVSRRKLKVLVTGGGAFNTLLIEILKNKIKNSEFELEEADNETICFKEALVFAFLGLRCLLGQENVLKAVTGGKCDSISGSIHRPMGSSFTLSKFDKFYFELRRHRSISCSSQS